MRFHVVARPLRETNDAALRLRWLAEQKQDIELQVVAHYALGYTLLCMGEFADARVDLDEAIARDEAVPLGGFVRRFPDLPRVRNVRALLEDPEIRLIVTAAIPSERAEIALEGARRARRGQRDQPLVAAAELLRRARRRTLERDGGGVLITQAIHTLDLTLSLVGPVAEVAAITGTTCLHRMATEDFAGAGLRFANGAYGALLATTTAYPGFPERIELIGTRATAILAGGVVTLHWHDGREERFGEEQGTGGGADPMAFPHDAHRALLADFLDALDQDRDPRVTGREALRVHHLIDAVLRASAEGRTARVRID